MLTSVCWVPHGSNLPLPNVSATGPEGDDAVEDDDQLDAMLEGEDDEEEQYSSHATVSSDDLADIVLQENDQLLLAATNEGDTASSLLCYLYNDEDVSLYVHHDMLLSNDPLCLEWVPLCAEYSTSSFVCVGSFTPVIDIWSLDDLHAANPLAALSGHTEAVLTMSWNSTQRNILASGSVDAHIRLWDLSKLECSYAVEATDKVANMKWCPSDSTLLAIALMSTSVQLWDVRQQGKPSATLELPSDGEELEWNGAGKTLYVSTESGHAVAYDKRKMSKGPLWSVNAHRKAATALTVGRIDGLMATGGLDKCLKLWDIRGAEPKLVVEEDKFGTIFGLQFSDYTPSVLAIAADKTDLQLWDVISSISDF